MIQCRIRQAAVKRGIKNPYQLALRMAATEGVEMGSRHEVLAGRLWKDGAQPALESINRVLQALPSCTLAELLVYKADSPLPAKKNGHKRKSLGKLKAGR